jgi:type II secretory pathway pseudopilin PulG
MRREDGMTLIEILVASSIMIVVISSTLFAFERFNIASKRTEDQNDAQAQARNALDLMTRQLRNHAAPAPDQQIGIDKAQSYDLVFQTVDKPKPGGSLNSRNVRRVRYCFDASVPANGKIWTQSQTWTAAASPAVPSTASCPDPAWGNQQVIASRVTNRYAGQNRSVWQFNSADIAHISALRTQLFTDLDPARLPKEQTLDTTVYFRNANEAPDATFTYFVSPNGAVILNATGSSDAEGGRVTYDWSVGGVSIGNGLTNQYEPGPGTYSVTLTVSDDAGMSESTTQSITVPIA